MLVPWARQAECLVPSRQLEGAAPRLLGQRYGQRLDQDTIDIVLRLRLCQAEGVHLHAIAEQESFRIGDAIAFAADLFPKFHKGTHFTKFRNETHTRIHEERDPPEDNLEVFFRNFAAGFHCVEHRNGCRKGVGQLLFRRRARFLQMVGADIHRIPLRRLSVAPGDHVRDQLHRWLGREHISAAREVFLDDVVLGGAAQLLAVIAALVGQGDIERQHPGGRRIDRHRRVHLLQRQFGHKLTHIAKMLDRHANLADFAACQDVVGVIGRLRGQVEGDGQAGLPLTQIHPVEFVRLFCGRMAGIGPKDPGTVRIVLKRSLAVGHGACASQRGFLLRRNMPSGNRADKPQDGASCGRRRAGPHSLHDTYFFRWPARRTDK